MASVAVSCQDGEIIGRGHNAKERSGQMHAEVMAIEKQSA